jgi:hypothetical protein
MDERLAGYRVATEEVEHGVFERYGLVWALLHGEM